MKKFFLFTIFLCLLSFANCQLSYWQQQVNYIIDVSLNDKAHTLDGFEKIEYFNNSPDTLQFIWIHLWPNAYKNDKTAYSDQALENGSTDFYFTDKENIGYINRLDFKVENITADIEDHPQHIDIIKLILPSALAPGGKINITTPFHVKLPFNFSRGGHDGQSYQVTQWYPKPAVYDHKGWHPMPYLDQGEFYSEFGNFDVSITLPKNYVVAATGELQNKDELEWLKSRSSFIWEPLREKVKMKNGQIQTVIQKFPNSSTEIKRIEFKQNNVHDFAWFADKRFIVNHDTCKLASGKIVDLFSYYTAPFKTQWEKSIGYIHDAIKKRSEWIGEYPYNVVSAVQGPESFGGGMEYPAITAISPMPDDLLFEYTLVHEISHNWFYGILASNERLHPWMDEGINTYYDFRHSEWKYNSPGEMKIVSENFPVKNSERLMFEILAAARKDQPISGTSEKFTPKNYNYVVYYKAGVWMELMEIKLGRELLDKIMYEYYRQWKFKHPYPEDLKKIFESISGQDLAEEFSLLNKTGSLPGMERKGWKTVSPLSPNTYLSFIHNPSKDWLLLSPIAGLNSYDKFMIGGLITNYKLPVSAFQFLFAPLYSTGAKKLNGLGKINYTLFPANTPWKIDIFMNASVFSSNEFLKSDGKKAIAGFKKIVPGFRFTLLENNPRSTTTRYIQWKNYFINEESFRSFYDTTISGTDTTIRQTVSIPDQNRSFQQLKLFIQNNRALYPYSAEMNIEQGKDFLRTAFTGNYFFNYPKKGGLNVRLFAGKFFYLNSKTFSKQFATDRYHLNMTGANGYEDYTYSDYFIGRNKFQGAASQQIMLRDGGFKVRTDQYLDKVGKTDDWLAALNFNTTIPEGINPLSVLPVKIPLKLFADIGTYAESWKRDANLDRFVFDAGLQLSFLANTINIYVPLVYSSVYKEYFQSVLEKKGRFFKTISFTIDISNFKMKKINSDFDF